MSEVCPSASGGGAHFVQADTRDADREEGTLFLLLNASRSESRIFGMTFGSVITDNLVHTLHNLGGLLPGFWPEWLDHDSTQSVHNCRMIIDYQIWPNGDFLPVQPLLNSLVKVPNRLRENPFYQIMKPEQPYLGVTGAIARPDVKRVPVCPKPMKYIN